jgi:hypothetical protein
MIKLEIGYCVRGCFASISNLMVIPEIIPETINNGKETNSYITRTHRFIPHRLVVNRSPQPTKFVPITQDQGFDSERHNTTRGDRRIDYAEEELQVAHRLFIMQSLSTHSTDDFDTLLEDYEKFYTDWKYIG